MGSEAIRYTREELEELFKIIFLGHAEPSQLILIDKLVFTDYDKITKELSLEVKETLWTKKKTEYMDIQEVLFCDKSKLPLLLNHRFYKVVLWRLKHDK